MAAAAAIAATLLVFEAAQAQTARVAVEDFRPLLVQAIDSPDGTAFGKFVGPVADALSTRMKTRSLILIDVTTVRRLSQPGCSRLNVRFSQEGVMLPGAAAPRSQTFDLGLNYCRDGRPPRAAE